VSKILQARPWPSVADELDYVSPSRCMKALGETYQSLVERAGGETAAEFRERYE
jgi:tRNA(Met) cytidine acetyltransferase